MKTNFNELRIDAERIKAKVYQKDEITSDELQTLGKYTQMISTTENRAAYACAKRLVKADNE
jgi:hypothetical protein